MKVFLGSYTCEYKDYCAEQFVDRLKTLLPAPSMIYIVDNTKDTTRYQERLKGLIGACRIPNKVDHIDVEYHEGSAAGFYPQRVIAESANKVREEFLKSDAEALLILESDVLPINDNAIELLHRNLDKYAIVGGTYYAGHHKAEWFNDTSLGVVELGVDDQSSLSGCTLYRRDLIERAEFKWAVSDDGTGLFPDALMSFDATKLTVEGGDFKRCHDTGVLCAHLSYKGVRGWERLHKDIKAFSKE